MKVLPVKPPVPCHEPRRLLCRVTADQKVGDDSFAPAPRFSVLPKHAPGQKRGVATNRFDTDSRFVQNIIEFELRGETRCEFGIDRLADDE